MISAGESTAKIQGAGSFNSRTVDLGHRIGYEENIEIHSIRKEALVEADDKTLNVSGKTCWLHRDNEYSIPERMNFADHTQRKDLLRLIRA